MFLWSLLIFNFVYSTTSSSMTSTTTISPTTTTTTISTMSTTPSDKTESWVNLFPLSIQKVLNVGDVNRAFSGSLLSNRRC